MTGNRRSKPTLGKRMTKCKACGYPLSQCHHSFPIAKYQASDDDTIQLCANCHELYHLFNEAILGSKRAKNLCLHASQSTHINFKTVSFLLVECMAIIQIEIEAGNIKPFCEGELLDYVNDLFNLNEYNRVSSFFGKLGRVE